jgi:hypothetical protein
MKGCLLSGQFMDFREPFFVFLRAKSHAMAAASWHKAVLREDHVEGRHMLLTDGKMIMITMENGKMMMMMMMMMMMIEPLGTSQLMLVMPLVPIVTLVQIVTHHHHHHQVDVAIAQASLALAPLRE